MSFSPLPATAAWQHRDARLGFEVACFQAAGYGYLISGSTTAAQDGQAWIVSYEIRLEQEYVRARDEGRHQRYDYAAPVFGFAARLVYDEAGLVLDYPGIALRAV